MATSSSAAANMVRSCFLPVGGVPTKLLSLGHAHPASSSSKATPPATEPRPKQLILIIPGNPGLSEYYEDFMQTIFHRLDEKVPVWAISHAGHEVPPSLPSSSLPSPSLLAGDEGQKSGMDMPSLKGHEHLYSLPGQISHKIRFVEEHVPADCHLTLIGHSIGCRMAIDVVSHYRQRQVASGGSVRAYNLFPMIEHMYETPNGFGAHVMSNYLHLFLYLLCGLLHYCLPSWLLRRAVSAHLRRPAGPASPACVRATMDFLRPAVVRNALFLARTELELVRELEEHKIKSLVSDLRFYFGASDGWCPLSQYSAMKNNIPGLRADICTMGMEHAFVLSSSEQMGRIVAEWWGEDRRD